MKLTTLFATFILTLGLMACNDHNPNGSDNCVDCGDNNTNNVVQTDDMEVETLSPKKTALWLELGNGQYDYALTKVRTSSDPDLVGHQIYLPEGPAAVVVTGEDQLIVMADDLFDVIEVTDVSRFEQLIRNYYEEKDEDGVVQEMDGYEGMYLPLAWQPNLFPTTDGQAVDLGILLSAFIRAKGLNLFSYGFKDGFSFSDFRYVAETSYYEWNGQNRAKYIFIIKR